ncbi:hypothetical protein NIM88_03935 [Pseudomonas sp. GBPI_506]|uniref:hypothetical protein n=1 Tax=Pseudomonas sp. GBPI_506 TaxID=1735795 RepID=UPI0020CFDA12|nr:hypothetical protein [Pseudomonas sp. GBPI_506]MCP9731537.1 hypothetical protein [Pseudomonas sp. GBPI_506]
MSEVKRFRADHRHVVETEFDDAQFVGVADFDRVTAERDALQALLTAADERADVLEGLLREAMPALDLAASAFKSAMPVRSKVRAALKPAGDRNEPNCLRCLDKKTVPSNLAEGYVMDCPDCCGEEG